MKIIRTKPIIFWDLETTGTKTATARILSMCMLKLFPDGTYILKEMLINPGVPIPAESTEVHGITDEMVKDAPVFKQVANSIKDFIGESDMGGYNSTKFDLPILVEEFIRSEVEFDFKNRNHIDGFSIMVAKEQRNLAAAVNFYLGEELADAHNATADTVAAAKVLMAQLEYYPDLAEMTTIEEVAAFCAGENNNIDLAGVFYKDENGDARYKFGKFEKELVSSQLGHLDWMIKKGTFTQQTKQSAKKMYDYFIKKTKK